jgi:hypothetical protein
MSLAPLTVSGVVGLSVFLSVCFSAVTTSLAPLLRHLWCGLWGAGVAWPARLCLGALLLLAQVKRRPFA